MKGPRIYSHSILKKLFPSDKVHQEIDCQFRHTFPLAITAIFTGRESPLQEAVNLVVCGRLRAKGYRLTLTCTYETPSEREVWGRQMDAFFWSIGETNIRVSTDVPSRALNSSTQLIILSIDSYAEKPTNINAIELTFPNFDILGSSPSPSHEFAEFLKTEIIHSWRQLIPAGHHHSQNLLSEPYQFEDGSGIQHDISDLINEVAIRKEYSPVIPNTHVDLHSNRTRDAIQDPDAFSILLHVAGGSRSGTKLDDLSEVVEGSFPRLLRALKHLLASHLITIIADRCFLTPATYSARDSLPLRAETSDLCGFDQPLTNARVQIYCYFAQGSFGYDTDDDDKCTAVRMIKANLAQHIELPPESCIVLDPSAEESFSQHDLADLFSFGVCLIDCPWYKLPQLSLELEAVRPNCKFRRLTTPPQDNSYYVSSTKISSAAAAAYLLELAGCSAQRDAILDLFEWGIDWRKLIVTNKKFAPHALK